MAEAAVQTLISLTQATVEACRCATTYQKEAGRIGARLTCLLTRTHQWDSLRRKSDEDSFVNKRGTWESFHDALEELYVCMEAAGTPRERWREKVALRLQGKDLLESILAAEANVNSAVSDLHLEQSNAILSEVMEMRRSFENVTEWLERLGQQPSSTNPSRTLQDEVDDTLNECYQNAGEVTILTSTKSDATSSTADETTDSSFSSYDPGKTTSLSKKPHLFQPSPSEYKSNKIDPSQLVYQESDLLGGGGFAQVFRGRYKGKVVAIKRLKIDSRDLDQLNSRQLGKDGERIAAEAILTQRCGTHANIVQILGYYDEFTRVDRPMIVMELMDTTLFDALHYVSSRPGTNPLTFVKLLDLMKGVAGALEFLHLQGIVHHDVKSLNMLLDAERSIAKLSDFGEAKIKGLNTTRVRLGTLLSTAGGSSSNGSVRGGGGTLAYQAPEVLDNSVRESSRVSEMYSFGVTVWECITRSIPHHGKRENTIVLHAAVHKEQPMLDLPTTKPSGLSSKDMRAWDRLKVVAASCLDRDRSKRPTASQVLQVWNSTNKWTLRDLRQMLKGTGPLKKTRPVHEPVIVEDLDPVDDVVSTGKWMTEPPDSGMACCATYPVCQAAEEFNTLAEHVGVADRTSCFEIYCHNQRVCCGGAYNLSSRAADLKLFYEQKHGLPHQDNDSCVSWYAPTLLSEHCLREHEARFSGSVTVNSMTRE